MSRCATAAESVRAIGRGGTIPAGAASHPLSVTSKGRQA